MAATSGVSRSSRFDLLQLPVRLLERGARRCLVVHDEAAFVRARQKAAPDAEVQRRACSGECERDDEREHAGARESGGACARRNRRVGSPVADAVDSVRGCALARTH